MLCSGVMCNMLDTGATTGAAGDWPGICSCMTSTGWQHGGLNTWGVGGSVQGGIHAACAIALLQRCWEAVAVQFCHIAGKDADNRVGQEGVALNNGPSVASLVIPWANMTITDRCNKDYCNCKGLGGHWIVGEEDN
jgi:hypothetical protein